MQTLCNTYLHCSKQVLRYVNGTMDQGIFYKSGATTRLEDTLTPIGLTLYLIDGQNMASSSHLEEEQSLEVARSKQPLHC